MDNPKEITLPCGNYKIDDQGNVYCRLEQFSERGKSGFQTKVTENWRKLNLVKNTDSGYWQVNINKKMWRVNRLIATYFIENKNNHPYCLHNNGDKNDNRAENLRWGNAKQNAEDALKHGVYLRGSKNPNSKLNEEKVVEIRNNPLNLSRKEFAKKFEVDQSLIDMVINNKIWKHIK